MYNNLSSGFNHNILNSELKYTSDITPDCFINLPEILTNIFTTKSIVNKCKLFNLKMDTGSQKLS